MSANPIHSSPAADDDPPLRGTRRRVLVSRGLACLLLLLSGLTLLGWHLGSERLTHWRADWVPMAYNTALAFAFLGASLLAATFGWRRLSRFLALFPLCLGIATIFQHLTGISLRLDQWAVAAPGIVGSQSPTFVALSTGFCFLLSGAGLWLVNRADLPDSCSFTINVLGCMVLAIAVAAMVGFFQGLSPEQAWGRFNLMAFHAAVGFAVTNTALLIWLRERKPPPPVQPSALPAVAAGMAVFTAALIFGQTLRHEESQALRKSCAEAADLAAASWTNQLHHYESALHFMAEVGNAEGQWIKDRFERLAGLLVTQHPDCQAVLWLTPAGTVRWSMPSAGHEILGLQPGPMDTPVHRALAQAHQTRTPVISETISLGHGGLGFLIGIPLEPAGQEAGMLAGVFQYASLAEYQWSRLTGMFEMRLLDLRTGNQLVYPAHRTTPKPFDGFLQSKNISYGGAHWRLDVLPRKEWGGHMLSLLPRVVLGGGAIMGVLAGWLIHLLQTASSATRQLRQVNEELQADMAERQRTEQALRESEAGLRLAQRVANVGSWELDLASQQLSWSDQTYRIFKVQPGGFVPTRENFYALVHPEDRQLLRQKIEQLVKESGSLEHEFRVVLPDGSERILEEQAAVVIMPHSGAVKVLGVVRDITDLRLAQREREKLIVELQEALENVKTLSGLLPICANCKKIRDDQGYWNQIEIYLQKHSDARFTHGLCPECVKKLYPELGDLPLPGHSQGPSES